MFERWGWGGRETRRLRLGLGCCVKTTVLRLMDRLVMVMSVIVAVRRLCEVG